MPPYVPPPPGWKVPEGISFAVVGAPRIEREQIVVRGELINTTSEPQSLYIWDAGLGLFPVSIDGPGISRKPVDPGSQRPEVYPSNSLYVLAPATHWLFESAVILPCYSFGAGTSATLRWQLNTTNHPLTGTLTIDLP